MTRVEEFTHAVKFEGASLAVLEFTPSLDMDRVPYLTYTVVIEHPGATLYAALDPRRAPAPFFVFKTRQTITDTATGTVLTDSFPRAGSESTLNGKAWITDVEENILSGRVTITASSGEVLLESKRRLATAALDTGATTVFALAQYAVADTGQVLAVTDAIVSSTALPAGERRQWRPGDTAAQLCEAELAAIDCRLYGDEYGSFITSKRSSSPGPGIIGSKTFSDGENGQLFSARETRSRRGDWADGVLVKFTYTNAAGAQVTELQRSGSGSHTRGIVTTEPRPAPAANLADKQVARAKQRGRTLTLTAQIDLYCYPGYALKLSIDGVTRPQTYTIRTVEWSFHTGVMTVTATTEG
ncbi:hypothetical protein [Glaciibacter psychrotolerans]|uniref:Uncharacterized protein n=1 Tax=Glaciibacter psychrotolerans TaxID=670054 RepID=A0A7Z0EH40_9MICO|nr:hypothetical protein [Leifsonia psychrotolerans]NYJ20804.1 hypothetical protein [Leifsonia psychrotolerans]